MEGSTRLKVNRTAQIATERHKRKIAMLMQATPSDSNPTRTCLVGASRHSHHQGNITKPRFQVYHILNLCNYCIQTLHIASRSGSRFIRHEQQTTEVRRPAREGSEAALHQTEPGRNNRDEPQRPCLTPLRSRQGRLNLSSFDSNPEPNPQNLRRGEANGPPEPIETARASAGRWVRK